jgi:hypothetical protein
MAEAGAGGGDTDLEESAVFETRQWMLIWRGH